MALITAHFCSFSAVVLPYRQQVTLSSSVVEIPL
jgi:hypothetical protein